MNYRYAQEYGGQKLHLVEDYGNGCVSSLSLCGRQPLKRGKWRMTINIPMGYACKNCVKITSQLKKPLPTIGVHVNIGVKA